MEIHPHRSVRTVETFGDRLAVESFHEPQNEGFAEGFGQRVDRSEDPQSEFTIGRGFTDGFRFEWKRTRSPRSSPQLIPGHVPRDGHDPCSEGVFILKLSESFERAEEGLLAEVFSVLRPEMGESDTVDDASEAFMQLTASHGAALPRPLEDAALVCVWSGE